MSGKTTELTLPGQTAEDKLLVDNVAARVREAYVEGGLATMRAVGRIVLDAMFGGDLPSFKARAKAHESFRALSRRDDIGISASNLWYAVNILENVQVLGESQAHRLPTAHHRLLTHVRDPAAKERLARQAIDRHWTVSQLQTEIRAAATRPPDMPKLGRPPLPAAVKSLGDLERAVRNVGRATPASVHGVEADEALVLRSRCQALRESVLLWVEELEDALAGVK